MQENQPSEIAPFEHFTNLDIRVGTVLEAASNTKAKKPAFILTIDFGTKGIKKSSAQLTQLYTCEDLIGKQVIAILNFTPRQVANVLSECLVLGCFNQNNEVVLLQTERTVENGSKVA